MLVHWVWILTTCWFPSRTVANRHWKLQKLWCVLVRLMFSLLTLSLQWQPKLKLKAKWGIVMSACSQDWCRRRCESWHPSFQSRIALPFSSTRFGKKLALSTAIQKPHQADGHWNSMLLFGWKCGRAKPLKMVRLLSATGHGSRLSRIKLHRRFGSVNLIFSMARAFLAVGKSWIWLWIWISSIRVVLGSAMRDNVLDRVEITSRNCSRIRRSWCKKSKRKSRKNLQNRKQLL